MIIVTKYKTSDMVDAMNIWNEVVREGIAFPQDVELTENDADNFFQSQSFTGVAVNDETREVVGLYILHPNNVGRCGHICNTSYRTWFPHPSVQCRSCNQQPCFASVRAFGLYATWKDSSRFSYEGWTL